MPVSLIAIDGGAAALFAGGMALAASPNVAANRGKPMSEPATYRNRILGAMIAAAALFLGGFSTMAWMAGS